MTKKEDKHHLDFDELSKQSIEILESGEMSFRIKAALFKKSDFVFVGSERGAGFIDKLFKDGRRITGRLVGESTFEEVKE